jgi:hypothetical protein
MCSAFTLVLFRSLTLTSYPFRIIQATRALNVIAGHDVVGESFYDLFRQGAGGNMFPSFGTTSSPLGISKVAISGQTPCKIQVLAVFGDLRNTDDSLLYYSVGVQDVEPSPAPIGSNRFPIELK